MSVRYLSFPEHCKNTYGHKLFRIPLQIGFTCPNRDGTLDNRGCIFCDGGSGDFALPYQGQRIHPEELAFIHGKAEDYGHYIAYFQAFTNTYGPLKIMRERFTAALADPCFAGIAIATRPDCLGGEVLKLLRELKEIYPDKFIWVELGLQTIHEESARWMRRGYPTEIFANAVHNLAGSDIDVIVHVIIGLPHENREDLLATIHYINRLPVKGIKLQLLHVLEDTDLAKEYREGKVPVLSKEDYVDLVCMCIAYLREDIVIHRLTGDGNPGKLIAPLWSKAKRNVLNTILHELTVRDITQGCRDREDRECRRI